MLIYLSSSGTTGFPLHRGGGYSGYLGANIGMSSILGRGLFLVLRPLIKILLRPNPGLVIDFAYKEHDHLFFQTSSNLVFFFHYFTTPQFIHMLRPKYRAIKEARMLTKTFFPLVLTGPYTINS
jgi:hypothetical protein